MTYRQSFLFSADNIFENTTYEGDTVMATSAEERQVQERKSLESLKEEAESLKEALKIERQKHADTSRKEKASLLLGGSVDVEIVLNARKCYIEVLEASQKLPDVSFLNPLMSMKVRKVLKRQKAKIMQFDWSADNHHVISGGQDGMVYVWDAFTEQKEMSIHTTCDWVLTCAYAPSTTKIACGGLDNKCSIYEVKTKPKQEVHIPRKVISHHTNYLTKCCFFGSDQQLLTGGADSNIFLWDLEKDDPVQNFIGHKGEILDVCIHHMNPFSVFASGSSDQTCCLWDARMGECVKRFDDFKSEVNGVKFFPTADTLGVACNDGTVHLIDLKAVQEVMVYAKPTIFFGALSLDFSQSGRLMFVGYIDHTIRAWDVLKGKQLGVWYDHQDRISHVQMSPDGTALGSSSWDGSVRIWA